MIAVKVESVEYRRYTYHRSIDGEWWERSQLQQRDDAEAEWIDTDESMRPSYTDTCCRRDHDYTPRDLTEQVQERLLQSQLSLQKLVSEILEDPITNRMLTMLVKKTIDELIVND